MRGEGWEVGVRTLKTNERDKCRRLDFPLEEHHLHRILGGNTSHKVHDNDIDGNKIFIIFDYRRYKKKKILLSQIIVSIIHRKVSREAGTTSLLRSSGTARGRSSDGDTGQQTSVITWAVGDLILHARKGGCRWWDDT